MPKLSKKVVDLARPGARPSFVWCSELKGFGVRVFPSGTKKFVVDYRNESGERKRMSIGAYGPLTVDDARKLALGVLGDAVRGDDPLTERQTKRKGMKVGDLCDRYIIALDAGQIMGKGRQPKKPVTVYQDKNAIERHIRPLLGKKLLADLKPSDIRGYINDVTAGKTATVEKTGPNGLAVVKGGPGAAERTSGLLGSMLTQAVEWGLIEINPARGVKRPQGKPRTRRVSPEEFSKIGAAIRQSEDQGGLWQGIAAMRLLILTGCRKGEILGLRWSEVDIEGHCLRLEDSKEGSSVRPLSKDAIAVLEGLERDSEYVLPATRGNGHYVGYPASHGRIMALAEIDGVTAHTFRHTFASVADGLGYSEATVATILGQKSKSVTRRYIHALDDHLISAADRTAAEISSQMGCK